LRAHVTSIALDTPALTDGPLVAHGPGKPDRTDRLVRRSAIRSGDATHRDSQIRIGRLQCAFSHGPHYRLTDRTKLRQILLAHRYPTHLAVIGVGDKTGIKPAGTAADAGNRLGNPSAG